MPQPLFTRAKALVTALANGPLGAWFLTLLLPFLLVAMLGLTLLLGPIIGPLDESSDLDEEPPRMTAEEWQQWLQKEQAEFERKRLEAEQERVDSERARIDRKSTRLNSSH